MTQKVPDPVATLAQAILDGRVTVVTTNWTNRQDGTSGTETTIHVAEE